MRKSVNEEKETRESVMEAVSIVGGRLAFLNKVSKARNMAQMAKHLLRVEKAWLLGQIGLIPDCDDDVMDEVRFAVALVFRLRIRRLKVGQTAKMEFLFVAAFKRVCQNTTGTRTCESRSGCKYRRRVYGRASMSSIAFDTIRMCDNVYLNVSGVDAKNTAQWRCRQIMTRPDYLEGWWEIQVL
jgi:hypothetical protein